ncbi:MAG: DUF302 domain-containing protein [Deltaproteobacteria bacterium]|nr:DUF302 domain-containing protein [Deltaproteobacteria bacterium]
MGNYGMSKKLDISYEEAIEKTKKALSAQGFGVLTEIDVKATLKKKLDKDFRKYIILGACNPPFAYRAFTEELEIGLLLPCNVIVYENEGGKGSTVTAVDPVVSLSRVGRKDMEPLAEEVKGLLKKALDSL